MPSLTMRKTSQILPLLTTFEQSDSPSVIGNSRLHIVLVVVLYFGHVWCHTHILYLYLFISPGNMKTNLSLTVHHAWYNQFSLNHWRCCIVCDIICGCAHLTVAFDSECSVPLVVMANSIIRLAKFGERLGRKRTPCLQYIHIVEQDQEAFFEGPLPAYTDPAGFLQHQDRVTVPGSLTPLHSHW